MSHPHIETRGKVLWYCRKIPVDLLPAYSGSKEIRHRLKTKDPKTAVRLARLRSVELDTEIALQCRSATG